ncbi:hypothetical protein [Paraconexibacter algicola]|uniref:Glycoside hydrolase family 5 domain-containing protein n=1 Tax=Paraconexibacter algicola TaxID=2133960 RepID=A0A2T4UC52_9ACTN|nr:hypothetical protein [Paraconexibacter algicola]PTL54818.1 hypothetical protein C7Y72_19720 [Paraconexibacter algicola]
MIARRSLLAACAVALAPLCVPAPVTAAVPTRMVAFPSAHAEIVVATTSMRDLVAGRAVRFVYIAERGALVGVRVTVRQGTRSWVATRTAIPAAAGGHPSGVALPPAAVRAVATCRPTTVTVAAFTTRRTPVAVDRVTLLRDAARCPDRPPRLTVPARPSATTKGIAVPATFLQESPARMAADLNAVRSLGAGFLRVPMDWPKVEARPGVRRWTALDAAVRGTTARRIGTLGLLTAAPRWASPEGTSYPRDPVRFAAFAARTVARYAPYGVRHWEVWNEPNFALFWAPAVDPASYARLLRLTSITIHAVQPRAVVISGGLARVDFDSTSLPANVFLEQMLVSGVVPQTDAIGLHPYTFPVSPLDPDDSTRNAWRLIERPLDGILALLRLADQESKPLWITEYGAPDRGSGAATGSPDGVGEARQAQLVTDLYAALRGRAWAGPAFWYALRDRTDIAASSVESAFGLLHADGRLKPAGTAYRALAP